MKLHNGIAIIERDSHLSKWVIEHNRLDFDQNALPQYLIFFPPGGTLVNVGANIGCYAYAFLNQAKEIYCYEPNPEAFGCLEYNLGKHDKVKLFNVAVSDKPGTCSVNAESENVGMAHIIPGSGEVPVIALDDQNLTACTFLLMDCEGYELHVLKGAEKTINQFSPVMVIEINDHTLRRTGVDRNEIFAWLKEHGYIYRNIYPNQGLNDDQLDIICFPR